jgi:hypothetical protein
MAASVGLLLVVIVPCVKSRLVTVLPTPSPICKDSVACDSASSNRMLFSLNPWVFMFARLSPTTFKAVVLASSPESAVENDDILFCSFFPL